MKKTIKLTEAQMKRIEEMTFDGGIDTPMTIPEYPQSQVTVSGKMSDDEFADPVTTDDVAGKMCKSFPWGTAYARGYAPKVMMEDDATGDGVNDMFNHTDANELNDGDETDDQQIIPHSVEMHLDRLIQSIRQADLPPKKQMNILNKLVDSLGLKGIPPSYKKETSMKIFSK